MQKKVKFIEFIEFNCCVRSYFIIFTAHIILSLIKIYASAHYNCAARHCFGCRCYCCCYCCFSSCSYSCCWCSFFHIYSICLLRNISRLQSLQFLISICCVQAKKATYILVVLVVYFTRPQNAF